MLRGGNGRGRVSIDPLSCGRLLLILFFVLDFLITAGVDYTPSGLITGVALSVLRFTRRRDGSKIHHTACLSVDVGLGALRGAYPQALQDLLTRIDMLLIGSTFRIVVLR